MGNSNVNIQTVVDFARTHTKLVPLVGVGGFQEEPARSIANDVITEILSAPFNWKFNRNELQMFATQQNKQDYLFAGAAAWVLGSGPTGGGAAIDLATNNGITQSGFTTTVNTLETHNFQVGQTVFMAGNTIAAYNSTFSITNGTVFNYTGGFIITAVPNNKQFVFTHTSSGLGTSGAPGITNYGWLESASVLDINQTQYPQSQPPIEAVNTISPSGEVGNPAKACVIQDLGNGILKIRLWPVASSYIWGIQLVYQAKAPLITSLQQSWAPIPDELAYVYRQGFLAKAYRYLDDARADSEEAKFQRAIMKALGIKDMEANNNMFYPERPIMWWG